jgi:hypothetical protein
MVASSRKSSVTQERLEGYKDLIETATNDLEARLETIDEKLEVLVARTATNSETTELQRIKDERSSTQKCLLICAQFSKLINKLQPIRTDGTSRDSGTIPERITSEGIGECRISMEQTAARLEKHMQDIMDQMMFRSGANMTQEDASNLARLREELVTTRQCRDICTKAEQHLKDNTSIIDNHATGDDAIQLLVSNSEKTIHGKNRGYGDQIRQVGGHLSDETIQKMSGDFLQMSIHRLEKTTLPTRTDTSLKGNDLNEEKRNWGPQYGGGRILKSNLDANITVSQELFSGAESDRS